VIQVRFSGSTIFSSLHLLSWCLHGTPSKS